MIVEQLYDCFLGEDAMLCEINPLVVTAGRQRAGARREVHHRRFGALPAPRACRARATPTRPIRSRRSRGKKASPTSSSTARWRSSGTAPALRCRPSTSWRAGGRPPTSAIWAAASNAERRRRVRGDRRATRRCASILLTSSRGITRCDEVARGMLAALDRTGLTLPIVVRFDGTNAEEGRPILTDAGRGRSMSSRRCSTPRGEPWSWRRERPLERTGRALPDEQGSQRRRRPRPARGVGGRSDDCARRRDRRRARRAAAARGGARGRELRPGARACSLTSSASPRICHSPTAASTSSSRGSRAHHFADVQVAAQRAGARRRATACSSSTTSS